MPQAESTPVDMLAHWAAERADEVYLRQPRSGVLHDLTWGQVELQARRPAAALRRLGLVPGDRVGLLSGNCAEWFVADLALMVGGYVSVPIYPTANAETIRYILEHSGAAAVFVGKLDEGPDRLAAVGERIPRLGLPYDTMPTHHGWQELLELAPPLTGEERPVPERIMSIVYTSGSTGPPKGAVHTFASLGWAGRSVARQLGATTRDHVVSYLPLAHITERAYIEIGSLYSGGVVSFIESRESFVDDLRRASPTLFISVPRLWALFRSRILARLGPRRLELMLRIPVVRQIVKRRIREALGLARARALGCGSAPVAPALLEWYRRIDIELIEAWGMTENAAFATINHPFDGDKLGSVGRPAPDCEVRVSEHGELLFRGPGLMTGYHRQPEATAAAFTGDGFLRTGDSCRIDSEGYVTITGRIKDNFKTAKGKYVVPLSIERELDRHRVIEQSCVVGSGLPQPIALVRITREGGASAREALRSDLGDHLRAVNAGLEPHAALDAIVVLDEPWTPENECLTPTLKVKRHVIERRFVPLVAGTRGAVVRWQDELEAKG